MKITREQLKQYIVEEISKSNSILLEMPGGPYRHEDEREEAPIVGQEQRGDYTKDPDGYEGELAKRSLFHMASQAQQLHDMLKEDENLEPWVSEALTSAAKSLEKAFKALVYDKQNPEGM